MKPVLGRAPGKFHLDGAGLEGKAKLGSEREGTTFGRTRHNYYCCKVNLIAELFSVFAQFSSGQTTQSILFHYRE